MNKEARIVDILLKSGLIDDLQLRAARAHQDQWGGGIPNAVVEKGFATEDAVVAALSQGLKVARISLSSLTKDPAALAKLDVDFATKLTVFPVSLKDNGKTLLLAMPNPGDLELIDQVSKRARVRVQVGIAGEKEIRQVIDRHYRNKVGPEPMSRHSPLVRREFVIESPEESSPNPAVHSSSGGSAATSVWTEDHLKRLETLDVNQQKVEKILQVLAELLGEKGIRVQR